MSDSGHARGRLLLRWLERIAGGVVVAFLAVYLARNWSEVTAHPWTIHCRPPNASDRPRLLRTPTLSRAT